MPKKQCIGKTFHVGSSLVTVEDVIAEGGFALVFLTRDSMGRRFALKRMYVNTEQDVLMCQQEIHILEALGKEPDSFIVRYFASTINDIDEEVKEVLILLEYYKYSVLQLMNERFQAKRHLVEEEVLNIFSDICHAVGKLHTHRPAWTHRDLKVENILIDKDGHCVLCDFGSCTSRILDPTKHSISEIEEDLKKYTTIAYRAPEMVNLYGFKKPITTKADIWALGVLLYKMCYFTLPFGESSLAIQNCNLQFPSSPAYSKHLTGLIRYCLKVNPDERPEIFQVTSLTCSLINRECLVPNVNRCAVLSPDVLLNLPESNSVPPSAFLETSPPRNVRPSAVSTQEFSSTTSIAPRERPKAATPAGGLVLLPTLNLKMAAGSGVEPKDGQVRNGTAAAPSSRPGNSSNTDNIPVNGNQVGSPFRPVAGAINPFRPPHVSSENPNATHWAVPVSRPDAARQTRMGHRRNTSDTSMVPAARPLSPTPTQNISEKSRSADASPARSPHPGGDVEKKFSNWNPFEDAEVWNQPPNQNPVGSLAHSLSSLVRGGSISSASRTTVGSPTAENGELKPGKAKPARGGASEVKKEKKKFRYQKFDNDSEEELVPSDEMEDVSTEPLATTHSKSGEKSTLPATGKEKDKDTDSIGSASDLKHEEDTTDDERHVEGLVGVVVPIQVDQEKIEDEDDGAYESVQYGTLEETASAIQSLVSHKSILQETSSKPLLDNGFDKSDDDDMEQVKPPAVTAVPQRRLTFESMGLLSVFDQIPFRQPKKSKTFASLKTSDQASLRLTDDVAFADTNPFSSSFSGSVHTDVTSGDSCHDFENIADRYAENATLVPPKLPPPVPPKPTFLRKEAANGNFRSLRAENSMDHRDVFSSFDGPSVYGHDPLNESLMSGSSHWEASDSHSMTSKSGKKGAKSKSPVFQEAVPLCLNYSPQSGSSPKLSKSPPIRRFRRTILPEGISNISFEDA